MTNDNVEEYSYGVITAVKKNFYVDYVLPSKNDEHSAILLSHDMIKRHSQGRFNLTNFTSNSQRLLSAVPNDIPSKP